MTMPSAQCHSYCHPDSWVPSGRENEEKCSAVGVDRTYRVAQSCNKRLASVLGVVDWSHG